MRSEALMTFLLHFFPLQFMTINVSGEKSKPEKNVYLVLWELMDDYCTELQLYKRVIMLYFASAASDVTSDYSDVTFNHTCKGS